MFRPDGTNVWTLDLEVPDGAMSSATLHVGDTDGDGVPDIAVMLQASTMHRSGPSSYSQDQQASYLVLVDRQGKLMLRKSISEYGDLLGIIPANPPELLVSDMYGVRRCRIAKPAETRQAKADDAAE